MNANEDVQFFQVNGQSMAPYLMEGEYFRTIPAIADDLKKGDLLAYPCPEAKTWVLHRLVDPKSLTLKGDREAFSDAHELVNEKSLRLVTHRVQWDSDGNVKSTPMDKNWMKTLHQVQALLSYSGPDKRPALWRRGLLKALGFSARKIQLS